MVSSHGGSPSRGKEKLVAVRTMNGRVAQGAGLVFLRLVVESGSRSGAAGIRGESVALQAEQVHLSTNQQSRIGRAVRCVACRTAFDLDDFMFIHIRPRFVRVAGEANQVLRSRGAQLAGLEASMRIVAIRAFH